MFFFADRRAVRIAAVGALTALTGLAVAACGGAASSSESPGGQIGVTAAFYPLQYAVERIGGPYVHVTGLTQPGAEPHDLELTPRQVLAMQKSTLIVYEKGFQPAVDDAVSSLQTDAGLDVSAAARLTLQAPAEGGTTDPGSLDPHFWLDPTRYADVVTSIGAELAVRDPAHAATYTANATAMVGELSTLDTEFRTGLAHCAVPDIVTGHAAFGYLAEHYGLTQVAISGISPDIEPTAAQLAQVVQVVQARHVSTVYAETLVSPALVETIARETGAQVKTLDPIEGITSESAGPDYFAVMRANLATLEKGQQCT